VTAQQQREEAACRLEAAARILRRPSSLGLSPRQIEEAVAKLVARAFEHLAQPE
jgi:hypothetical protein